MTIPILQNYIKEKSNKKFVLSNDTKIISKEYSTNNKLQNFIAIINKELVEKNLIDKELEVLNDKNSDSSSNIIIEIIDDESIKKNNSEAYKILISENIEIMAQSELAAFYALRTLEQLILLNDGIYYGEIVDYPDLSERRLHIDIARKYISKDFLIDRIHELSWLKMNTLQIHFSENHGFRIESEFDPEIVSDEHLTKAEIREIINEANKYGIELIPAFDTPGHVDHILRTHPEYGQVDIDGNHSKYGLDITNPEVVEYFKSLYKEYMELFKDSKYFHIGGDEYMEFHQDNFKEKFKPVLEDYAKKNIGEDYTWKDTFANFINSIAELVYENGFIPRVWNDGLYYGEYSDEAPQKIKMYGYIGIDYWSHMPWTKAVASLQTILDRGHNEIYNNNSYFFYYVLRPELPDDGRKQASFDHHNADKKIFEEWTSGNFPNEQVDDDADFIKGVSMHIWCDEADIVDEDTIAEDIYNEIRALATKSWNQKSNELMDYEKFKELIEKLD